MNKASVKSSKRPQPAQTTDLGDTAPPPNSRVWLSSAALVASNLVPFVGVVFFGWSMFIAFAGFWLETVVVGIFTVLRLWVAQRSQMGHGGVTSPPRKAGAQNSSGAFAEGRRGILMFAAIYAWLTVIPGIIAFAYYGTDAVEQMARGATEGNIHALSPELQTMGPAVVASRLGIIFGALVVNYGVSFLANFMGGKESMRAPSRDLVAHAVSRLFVFVGAVLLGAGAVIYTGSTKAPIGALVLVKTGVDLAFHLSERRKFAGPRDRQQTRAVRRKDRHG